MKTTTRLTLAALCLGTGIGAAQADALDSVAYSAVQGTLQAFESLVVSNPLGSLIDGVLNFGGLQFGERFAGQELALAKTPRLGEPLLQDWFDDLAFGTPTAGLSLLAGAAGANLGA